MQFFIVRKLKLFLSIGCFLITLPWVAAGQETISLSAGDWSPYLSEDLKYQGIAARIIKESFASQGVEVTINFYPWQRAFEEAKLGREDGTAVWLEREDRKEFFYYSEPVVEEFHVFFHLKDQAFDWNAINDLKNFELGGLVGFSYGKLLDDAITQGSVSINRTPNDESNFNKLLKGRIDLYPQEMNVGYEVLQKSFGLQQVALITNHPKPFLRNFSYLMLSKKNPQNQTLLKRFNTGLRQLKESGKYEQYFKEAREGAYRKN